jgi:hypothetical protein
MIIRESLINYMLPQGGPAEAKNLRQVFGCHILGSPTIIFQWYLYGIF